ncbi:integrase arm-type DNA-binding domain-containing protein [Sphingomonas sp.]|uniref:tyrosine-type recombinase/integrase n=1 Tax=Sphingomonas sp. TaxID=28214 RepID=UPI000DAFDEDD|nr:integrase arm-type DNA-binding domain-containing protein [Sphingomonas sp.]PZU10053.1 MAG: integrase [Sphingomonas sp.]
MLTAARIRAAAPTARAYKLADAGGLHLHVAPSGRRTWRWSFRLGGKPQLLTLGAFPDVSLADARELRDEARRRLRAGEDPRRGKAPDQPVADNNFETIARRWHAAKRSSWSTAHAGDVLASLETHVFPAIGAMPITAINAPVVLQLLQRIEERGSIETARRVCQRISAIFVRAIAEAIATHDPAAIVRRALADRPDTRRQAALTDIDQVRGAFAAIGAASAPAPAIMAAQLVALTAVRCGSARGARWEEFEGIAADRIIFTSSDEAAKIKPTWRIPAARMKLKRSRKADAAYDHIVQLAPAAVELLRRARAAAGGSPFVFPRRAGAISPIGENAILDVHAAAGLAGRHSPHGWRAAFSTILNERRPADRAAIDLTLAHAPKDKVEAAYNRAQHHATRRSLFEEWAEILTAPTIEPPAAE